ncbi:MAG TPA: hypothetical protein VHS81_07110, partial [Caulobacteraceae bacterium]|nr:hypothetical protein [Caulobacteraceae bacterium]
MKTSLLLGAVVLIAALAGFAHAQQPPLIDRNAFFGEVQISGAQISPDGKWLTFLKPYKGVRNIWIKKAGEPFSTARPISADAHRPIRQYFWSRDARYVLYAQDHGGDENFNIYAIDPNAGPDAATGLPPTRALTDMQKVRVEIYAAPKTKPDILYIGLNDRDPRYHDLYQLRISTGEKTLLKKNTDEIAAWDFDNAGELRLAERTTAAGDTEILRVDPSGFTKIYGCTVLESCGVAGFDAANAQAYLETNKGDRNLVELDTLDPNTGEVKEIESDPLKRVDLGGVATSELDYRILYTSYEDDRVRRYFRDKALEAQYAWLKSKLPGMEVDFGSVSADENVWIVVAHSDVEPGAVYLWN